MAYTEITKVDFRMAAGDTPTINFTIKDLDSNAAQSVTGATIAYTISETIGGTALVSKATGGGGITISGSAVAVALDAADTAALAGIYYHAIEITDSGGDISTAWHTASQDRPVGGWIEIYPDPN